MLQESSINSVSNQLLCDTYSLNARIRNTENEFTKVVFNAIFELAVHNLWPSKEDISSDEIKRSSKEGKNLVDGVTEFLFKYDKKKILKNN